MEEHLRTLSTISTLDEILYSVKWESSHFFEEPIHIGLSNPVKISSQTQTLEKSTLNATTQTNINKINRGCQFFVEMNTTSTQTINSNADISEMACILDDKIKIINCQIELILGQVQTKLDDKLLQLSNLSSNIGTLKNTRKIQSQRAEFEKSNLLLEADEEKSRKMLQIEELNEYLVISLQRAVKIEQLWIKYLLKKSILDVDDQINTTIICNSSSVSDPGKKEVTRRVTPNQELCMLLDECCAVLDD
ncbi:unnamed protein product [Phytomonas sp. Hart1]|nr:unnamed protein product [Phytomonas sp. Hart1]|eukprot:CCW71010.1 unnamed protein product [Phytomonas sp. isolate Hart1]